MKNILTKVYSMIEVLYISYDGMTDPLGQSQVIPYLIGLSEQGYHFTIVSSEKRASYRNKRQEVGKLLEKHNIDWAPVFYTKNPPVISTLIDIMKMKHRSFSLYEKKKFAIVHCRSYISSLIGLKMKIKFGVKFIFDMRGLWADERVDGGLWNLKNPFYNLIYKFFKKKEIEFFQKADQTVSLTENGKKEILSWPVFKYNPIPITVIPCCVDLILFDPEKISAEQKRNLRKQLNITENTFVLSYLGSLGTWYLLNDMLNFFSFLQKKIPEAVFLFIINDDENAILQIAKRKLIAKSTIIIKRVPHIQVPLYLSLSQATVFFIKPCYSKKFSSPTKLAEVVSMFIPVIANTGVGDLQTVFEEVEAGYLIHLFNQNEYESAVNKIISMSFRIKKSESTHLLETYSLNTGITRYAEIYKRLVF